MPQRLFFLLSLLLGTLVQAADILPAPRQVSEHAWAWIGPYGPPTRENGGFRMNLGFVVGRDVVAVIDAGYSEAMAESMLAHIRRLTDRPVRYLIDTNSQPHRVMGNLAFRRAGAEIIAAAAAISRITGEGAAYAAIVTNVLGLPPGSVIPPAAPDRSLEGETVLDLGGVSLRLLPVGHAHTDGSLVVVVSPDGVVFAGDVLYGDRLLAVLPESRISGWLAAFERLRGTGAVLFVPGHGEPGALAAFEHPTRAYLDALKRHMEQAVATGTDLQDAINGFDQSPWATLADFDALAGRNAHQGYLQSEQAAFE